MGNGTRHWRTHLRGTRVLGAGLLCLVLGAGCADQPTQVTIDAATAETRAVEQLAGTYRYTVRLDDTLEGAAARELFGGFWPGLDPAGARLDGGVGADGSVQLRVTLDEAAPLPLVDLRVRAPDDAVSQLTAGEPIDATATAQVDVVAAFILFDQLFSGWTADPPRSEGELRDEAALMVADTRERTRGELPQDVFAVLDALLDGEHAGFDGTITPDQLDVAPAAAADQLGLTWLGPADQLDVDTVTAHLRDVTILTAQEPQADAAGRTVFAVDVDTVRLAEVASEMTGQPPPSTHPLPDVLEDAATLTFDPEGDLVELRVHLLEVLDQLPEATELGGAAIARAQADGGALDLVLALSDHDEVDTVLSPAATTTGWDWPIANWLRPPPPRPSTTPAPSPPPPTNDVADPGTGDTAAGPPVRVQPVPLGVDPDRALDCRRMAEVATDHNLQVQQGVATSDPAGCALPPALRISVQQYDRPVAATSGAEDTARQIFSAPLEMDGGRIDAYWLVNFDDTVTYAVVDETTTTLLKVETVGPADLDADRLAPILAEVVRQLT